MPCLESQILPWATLGQRVLSWSLSSVHRSVCMPIQSTEAFCRPYFYESHPDLVHWLDSSWTWTLLILARPSYVSTVFHTALQATMFHELVWYRLHSLGLNFVPFCECSPAKLSHSAHCIFHQGISLALQTIVSWGLKGIIHQDIFEQ